jgi:hypothetical protein
MENAGTGTCQSTVCKIPEIDPFPEFFEINTNNNGQQLHTKRIPELFT